MGINGSREPGAWQTSERGGKYTTGLANTQSVCYLVHSGQDKPQACCVRGGMAKYIQQD